MTTHRKRYISIGMEWAEVIFSLRFWCYGIVSLSVIVCAVALLVAGLTPIGLMFAGIIIGQSAIVVAIVESRMR